METLFTMGLMVLLAIMFALTLGISGDTIPGDVLGARGFPLAMIVLGFVLCILILVRQARTKTEKGSRLLDLSRPEGRAALAACGALVAYIALLNFLGYILSTLLFSVSAARLTGFRKVGALVLFAVMTTAVLFLLFAKLFFVPLPRGAGFLRELSYLIY